MTDKEWEMVVASEIWEAIDRERVDAARKRQRAAWKKMFGDDSDLTDDTLSAGDGEPEEDTSESACWDRLMDEAAKEHMECRNYFQWRTWYLEDNRTIHTVDYCFNDEDLYDDDPPEPIP